MLTKKVYQDVTGRLHDKATGTFTQKPREMKSYSGLETPYFSQDEQKPQTYNRTGVTFIIERDGQEVFDTVFSWSMIVSIVVIGISKLF